MFDKKFYIFLQLFVLLNIALYIFILFFNNKVPFHIENYVYNSHHFIDDARVKGNSFNLINAFGVYDAQWYLKITHDGYPKATGVDLLQDRTMENLTYAFFPLYPILLFFFNLLFHNIELTAFILANLLMVANFVSLYYVITKFYRKDIALKTIFLLFTFPFSVFYRSYFTEGLFLLLFVWFCYFLIKKKALVSGFLQGLLMITRPNGFFILIPYCYFLIRSRRKGVGWLKIIFSVFLSFIPLSFWILFNFIKTGNPIHFYTAQSSWLSSEPFYTRIFSNISQTLKLGYLTFHAFHASQVDVVMIVIGLTILLISRKKLKPELWLIAVFLFILPLFIKDTMSFTRYQIVVFPFFLYLALVLKKWTYVYVLAVFTILLFLTSLYFVNWFWVG